MRAGKFPRNRELVQLLCSHNLILLAGGEPQHSTGEKRIIYSEETSFCPHSLKRIQEIRSTQNRTRFALVRAHQLSIELIWIYVYVYVFTYVVFIIRIPYSDTFHTVDL